MSYILAGGTGGLLAEAVKSLVAICVCAMGMLNIDLWATQALLLQSVLNLLLVPVVLIVAQRTGNDISTAPGHSAGDG